MSRSPKNDISPLRLPTAVILTWLLPGAGHIFLGQRARGLIILLAIGLTFWIGVAVGGVKYTVDPVNRQLWFIGQICAGVHSLACMGIGSMIDPGEGEKPTDYMAFDRAEEVSVVYTAICGMLAVFVMLDAWVLAERPPVVATGPAGKLGGTS